MFEYDFEKKVFRNPGIVDISYRDPQSSMLSNLFPHPFTMKNEGMKSSVPFIRFVSMEAFLRSLCWKGEQSVIEQEIAPLFGINAVNIKYVLPDWKKAQTLFWNGMAMERESQDYQQLLKEAYHCLFQSSHLFQNALKKTEKKVLIHSIGKNDPKETLLTQEEFITNLNQLREYL